MNILVTICARGGSKGVPGKNIKNLNGKPLIAYTVDLAQQFAEKYAADVSLSSDDDKIISVAERYGLTTNYKRPDSLASDTAGKIGVIQHLLAHEERGRGKKYDYIIDLDVTSPMRTIEDLEKAFDQLQEKKDALNIFSVSPAHRNPYFNMVEQQDDGYVSLVKQNESIKARQAAPSVYDMNASFYIYRRSFFEEGLETCTTSRSLAYVMEHICFDIDNVIDFEIMEMLLKKNLLDFEI